MTGPEQRIVVLQLSDMVATMARQLETMSKALVALEVEMHRRSPVKRARAKAPRVTPAIVKQVWAIYVANPDMGNVEIGQRCGGIDGGRVSEILAGKRT